MDAPSYVDAAMYDRPIEELGAEELANSPPFSLILGWKSKRQSKVSHCDGRNP